MANKMRHTFSAADSSMLATGYSVVAKLGLIDWFKYIATPTAGSVYINNQHVLHEGEIFLECYVLPETVGVSSNSSNSTAGGLNHLWSPQFFLPGDDILLKDWIVGIVNEPLVLFLEDPSGQTLQFGSEKNPLYISKKQFVSGKGGNIKGYRIECTSTERYFYKADATIGEILASRCAAFGYPLDVDEISEDVYYALDPTVRDKSNFLLVPLGYDTSVVYALDNYLFPLPVPFSRASSATRYDKTGVPETVGNNIPRLQHDPATLKATAYLREGASTNLVSKSETDSAGSIYNAWGNYACYVPIAHTGSFGTFKEYTLTELAGFNQNRLINGTGSTESPTNPTIQTLTFQAKANGRHLLQINNNTYYNLLDGTSSGTSPHKITDVGNGWYEIQTTFTLADTWIYWVVFMTEEAGIVDYVGDGVSGVKLRMIQIEMGACASSYIPTTGSQVTRLAETFSYQELQTKELLSADKATSYIEAPIFSGESDYSGKGFAFLKGADLLSDHLAYSIRSASWVHDYVIDGVGSNTLNETGGMKVATQFGSGSLKQYHQGVRVLDEAYIDTMYLSGWSLTGDGYCMHLKVLALFKEGLLNAQLISLTS